MRAGGHTRPLAASDSEQVVAVKPRPELAPFFALDCQSTDGTRGTDGSRIRHLCVDSGTFEPWSCAVAGSERAVADRLAHPSRPRHLADCARASEYTTNTILDLYRHTGASPILGVTASKTSASGGAILSGYFDYLNHLRPPQDSGTPWGEWR